MRHWNGGGDNIQFLRTYWKKENHEICESCLTRVCVCADACACMCVCGGAHKARDQCPAHCSAPCTLYFSLADFEALIQLDWLARKPRESSCLLFPGSGITGTYITQIFFFYKRFMGPNSGPHACVASTWLTEPSPQPFRCSLVEPLRPKDFLPKLHTGRSYTFQDSGLSSCPLPSDKALSQSKQALEQSRKTGASPSATFWFTNSHRTSIHTLTVGRLQTRTSAIGRTSVTELGGPTKASPSSWVSRETWKVQKFTLTWDSQRNNTSYFNIIHAT